MKLPKTLYVAWNFGATEKDNWLSASTDKNSLVEEGGEIVGTYELKQQEVGETKVYFKPKR